MNLLIICVTAFISEYLDSGLGMGYGTALAPILIIIGYNPLQIVPAILISQLITDITACVFHHNCSNVDLRIKSDDFLRLWRYKKDNGRGFFVFAGILDRIKKMKACAIGA